MWKWNFSTTRHVCTTLAIVTTLLAGGCAKPYLPPTIEEPLDSSNHFDGLLTLLEKHGAVHVLWIHGMCPHSVDDWAKPRVDALAKRLGIEDPTLSIAMSWFTRENPSPSTWWCGRNSSPSAVPRYVSTACMRTRGWCTRHVVKPRIINITGPC